MKPSESQEGTVLRNRHTNGLFEILYFEIVEIHKVPFREVAVFTIQNLETGMEGRWAGEFLDAHFIVQEGDHGSK